MTFKKLKQVIEKHNIPEGVHLLSDSGWECFATEMDGVYYNECKNVIVFTQVGDKYDDNYTVSPWKRLHSIKDEGNEF
jgi:hypothetical protein